jgi:hypothetical protein
MYDVALFKFLCNRVCKIKHSNSLELVVWIVLSLALKNFQ